MFILLWSFGNNKKNYLKLLIENQNILPYKQVRNNSNYSYKWAPYLAGLIEGDG